MVIVTDIIGVGYPTAPLVRSSLMSLTHTPPTTPSVTPLTPTHPPPTTPSPTHPQFEQHLRAVLGWPLGDPSLHCGSAIMFNILGEADGEAGVRAAHRDMRKALEAPGAKFHWYGKEGVNKARKVGHVTVW